MKSTGRERNQRKKVKKSGTLFETHFLYIIQNDEEIKRRNKTREIIKKNTRMTSMINKRKTQRLKKR